MTDTCTITRAARGRMNGSTFAYADTPTTVYEGKCRVASRQLKPSEAETGGLEVVQVEYVVSVPVTVTGVAVGDVVSVDTSLDPGLADVPLVVRAVETKSHATARRLTVEVRLT